MAESQNFTELAERLERVERAISVLEREIQQITEYLSSNRNRYEHRVWRKTIDDAILRAKEIYETKIAK